MGGAPIAQFRRQVAPRRRCAGQPENGINEQPVVSCGASTVPLLVWNKRFNPHPLRVGQGSSAVALPLNL